jgi:hypothetical protein
VNGDARPRTDRPQKDRGLQDSDDGSSVASNFWSARHRIIIDQVTLLPSAAAVLVSATATTPLHYLSSRPYLTTTMGLLATLHLQPGDATPPYLLGIRAVKSDVPDALRDPHFEKHFASSVLFSYLPTASRLFDMQCVLLAILSDDRALARLVSVARVCRH